MTTATANTMTTNEETGLYCETCDCELIERARYTDGGRYSEEWCECPECGAHYDADGNLIAELDELEEEEETETVGERLSWTTTEVINWIRNNAPADDPVHEWAREASHAISDAVDALENVETDWQE